MTPAQTILQAARIPPKARRRRAIRGWMREESVGAPAVLSLAWALAALAGSLLLWGGISHDWLRAVLLLAAAGAIRGRRALARLGATMPMDAKGAFAPVGPGQRWGERVQEAIILMAAGLCGYGSGFWIGPVLGVLAIALLMLGGFLPSRVAGPGGKPKFDPAVLMAMFITAAAAEPLWGWRGQVIVLGLLAVCTVLAWRLYRRLRPAAPAA